MNVIRDGVYLLIAYPFSLVRRFTVTTWSFLSTRGLVNYIPFVRRKAVSDSSSSNQDASGAISNTNPDNSITKTLRMNAEQEKLVSVVVSKEDDQPESESLSGASLKDPLSTTADLHEVVCTETGSPSTTSINVGESASTFQEATSPVKKFLDNLPTHQHLAAKRNSSTLEKESLSELIESIDEKSTYLVGETELDDDVIVSPTFKRAKLDLLTTAVPKFTLEDVSADNTKAKERIALKIKEKKKHQQNRGARLSSQSDAGGGGDDLPRVNHFIGIQISNPEIHSKMEEIQKKMLEKELTHAAFKKFKTGTIFSNTMISTRKSHVTLHVCHLKDDDQVEMAKSGLRNVWNKCKGDFEKPLSVKVDGIGHFKNNVLFAKIHGTEEVEKLKELSDLLKEEFQNLDIQGDEKNPFNPHLTLAKMTKGVRKDKLFRKHKIRTFPRELWFDFSSTFFGYQTVESLQLLKMKADQDTGYYEIIETYPFKTNTPKSTNPLGNDDSDNDEDLSDNNNLDLNDQTRTDK